MSVVVVLALMEMPFVSRADPSTLRSGTSPAGSATSPGADFTIIALPDTQYYAQNYPQIFTAQTQWIVSQKDARNIVFVTHLGDIVQDADELFQWDNANTSMTVLDGPSGVPYGLVVGNHDEDPRNDPDGTANFNLYFPYTRHASLPWYGGHYGTDNDNSYQLFSAGGMDFVIVHLEFDPDANSDVLDWADNVLTTYGNRRAIVSSHYILSKTEPGEFGPQGQAIYDALKNNANLFLMLCGHCSQLQEGRRTDVFNGNTVYALLSDYQRRSHGGDGWLRILEFSPVDNEVRVKTYSPTLDQYETDANSEFILIYDMGGIETVPPDFDRDGDVDQEDFGYFQACFAGPLAFPDPGCEDADLNGDHHVDQDDFGVFQGCLSGADVPADPECAD